MSSGTTSRPVTSKPRGICKYYTTDPTKRGCFAGSKCKFLHGEAVTHSPFDQSKTCRFYAAGFCKRGTQCWYIHAKGKEKQVIDDDDDLCSICFDKPITYGLLTGCSHIFCIACIKQWRDPINKSVDVVESGNTKRCPMCRQPAKFIIPSSKFYAQGQEAKDAAMARYMDSMRRVPCKYFQKSILAVPSVPFCPFGKDCFYQHRNLDGSDYITDQGVETGMRMYASQRVLPSLSGPFPHRSELIRSLENVFAETARLGLNPPMRGFADDGSEDETTVMRRLEILADQMLASLAGQGARTDSESESDDEGEAIPPLEHIGDRRTEDWPLPLMFDSDTDTEMPPLASVSNSSDSEDNVSDDEQENPDSSSEDQAEATNERMQTVRPFDLEFDPGRDARNENAGMFVRLSSFWRAAGAVEEEAGAPDAAASSVDTTDEGVADDEPDMPPLEREPPFVTDGRGRVVWSSSSGTGYPQADSSSVRRASITLPGAFPSSPPTRTIAPEKPPSPRQPTGEGGFMTDGRGRVIGTTGTRAEEEEEERGEGSSDAPAQPRSFFGRVLDVFF
ncbi:hypothetical protein B0H17DRAFT_1084017 [Mycena rosella]|uniref:RING-type E3 ubiquitin transferase n=1 Tax=Mycena rosella TaxID=1033263 RepID=A0AAD7GAF8_MYCRO|nr:hypothetical protein B0H17DRAFT_1084017 [Mycena rosella]